MADAAFLAHDHLEPPSAAATAASEEAAATRRVRFQLTTAMVFCFVFMIGEVVGGYLAGSLAIMTDAAHLLSDVAAFLISLFAVWVAGRPATESATWGYHRFEVFGAVGSVFLIWIITGVLCVEAVQRIINPETVDGRIMFVTATAGLLVNLAMMKILHQGHGEGGGHSHAGGGGHSHGGSGENLNVRAAFVHVLGDLVQSVGVMLAAALIWAKPEWHVADPICTFVFSILVLFTTVGILRTAYATLLNSVPEHIKLGDVARDLAALRGVSNVHDLHVWGFGTSARVALSVHLVADDPAEALLGAQGVAAHYGIKHSTVQVERCGSADIAGCASANVHSEGCTITFASGASSARAPSPGGDRDTAALIGGSSALRLRRPSAGALHTLADGTSHAVSPRAVGGHAHAHKGSACDHGHAHGGGHSHAGGGAHSHGKAAASDHGHSHTGGAAGAKAHSHAHDAGGHGHSHAAGAKAHSHAHGGGAGAVAATPPERAAAEHGHAHDASGGGHGHAHA